MLHFNVRKTHCRLNNNYVLWYRARKSRPHVIDKPVDISLKYFADFFEPHTKEHVVEKAIGGTHIEMKHPACCTTAQKSFLNLEDFLYLIIALFFVPFVGQGHVAGLLTE